MELKSVKENKEVKYPTFNNYKKEFGTAVIAGMGLALTSGCDEPVLMGKMVKPKNIEQQQCDIVDSGINQNDITKKAGEMPAPEKPKREFITVTLGIPPMPEKPEREILPDILGEPPLSKPNNNKEIIEEDKNQNNIEVEISDMDEDEDFDSGINLELVTSGSMLMPKAPKKEKKKTPPMIRGKIKAPETPAKEKEKIEIEEMDVGEEDFFKDGRGTTLGFMPMPRHSIKDKDKQMEEILNGK